MTFGPTVNTNSQGRPIALTLHKASGSSFEAIGAQNAAEAAQRKADKKAAHQALCASTPARPTFSQSSLSSLPPGGVAGLTTTSARFLTLPNVTAAKAATPPPASPVAAPVAAPVADQRVPTPQQIIQAQPALNEQIQELKMLAYQLIAKQDQNNLDPEEKSKNINNINNFVTQAIATANPNAITQAIQIILNNLNPQQN
jgi:hypothetical protein